MQDSVQTVASQRGDRDNGRWEDGWDTNYRRCQHVFFQFGDVTIAFFTTNTISFQFTSWVDAVIFVFSLENETSFNAIYNYYAKMSQYRNMQDIPLILVGTQGEIMRYMTLFQQVLTPLVTTYLALHRGAV